MIIEGRQILNFGGCPYLGLANEPILLEAGLEALRSQGAVCQLPRHYGFEAVANRELEAAAREYFGAEAAMYFATGYLFGLIAMAGLDDEYDVILLDELAHFTLVDGAQATRKPIHRFRHCDADSLAAVLVAATAGGARPLVATDGMFATYGNSPPLAAYARALVPHDGWLVIDESHSFGVLGPTGRGAAEAAGLDRRRTLAGGSLGKAFCGYGGLAIGEHDVIERLRQTPAARGAALGNPSGAAMAAAAMRLLRAEPQRLQRLRRNIDHLQHRLEGLGLSVRRSEAPVRAFTVGDAATMRSLWQALWDEGIYVILSNYIGAGASGAIRIAAFADHEPRDFDRLADALARVL